MKISTAIYIKWLSRHLETGLYMENLFDFYKKRNKFSSEPRSQSLTGFPVLRGKEMPHYGLKAATKYMDFYFVVLRG